MLDGLTQSEVYDIEQDNAGYLWFTTARGLNRYDGREFDHYTIADGLPTNSLTALYADSDNAVWVGDVRGGITIIQDRHVVDSIEPIGDDDTPILDIEETGGRILAVAQGVGIVVITAEDRKYQARVVADSGAAGVTDLTVFGTDVWVASATGLYRLTFGAETRLELLDDSIRRIHTDSTGNLWVADVDGQVGVWQDGRFTPSARIVSDTEIVSVVTNHTGVVWVATNYELFGFDSDGRESEDGTVDVRRYTEVDRVTSLFVDHENSLWLSSDSRLIRFLGDRFQHHRLRTTADPETVWSISEDRIGRLWFGTQTKLLMKDLDESLVVVGPEYGIPVGVVRDLAVDSSGDIWGSVTGAGLFHVDVDTLRGTMVNGTDGFEIFDIELAKDGAVWFSTMKSGLFRYVAGDDHLTRFETPNGTSVYTLDIGADGSVWYGADGVGLIRLIPNTNAGYDQELVEGSDKLYNRNFDHLRLVAETTAWVATEEGGLYLYENGVFSDLGKETALADQTVYLVEPLPNGSIVVGGELGLYQFVPGEPGFHHFDHRRGFVGIETNVHASYIDSSGFLWIGTVDGATRMNTSGSTPKETDPVPSIVSVETELDRVQILDNTEIEPTQLGARVEYAAISLLRPRGTEYSYKLVGIDDTWGPETTNRSVSYARIPPGSYEFMVRARNPGGAWGESYASHRFTVLPFFWQQSWFAGAVILLVLLGFWAAIAYRIRHFEWLNEKLRAQVEERTQSIEKARQNLQVSNVKLSKEVEARAELETRFRRAFENAPIGMGLLDVDGVLFDANPALKNMFWPLADTVPEVSFAVTVCEYDRESFVEKYQKLVASELDSLDEKLSCMNAEDTELQTVVNISTVRADAGDFLYAVLQIQDVTESLKLTTQLERQATSDELTGLLNRRAFQTALERASEPAPNAKSSSYLIFMDLDQFKVVNDTSGHTAGDELLRAVSKILVDSVRVNDVVARLGGDEFGLILWECPTEVAARIAESIRAAIEALRFTWGTETYRIGVSIGGLSIEPSLGNVSELQQLADAACYAAKEAGRNRVHMISGDKDSARIHRSQVRWVQRIRDAMDNNKFAIYAQTIQPLTEDVDEPDRLEILLRLRDPETRKLVPPGAFLPATERYGLSVELDMWVVRSLLSTLFVHQAFQASDRSYWINLSGTSICDHRFSEFLKGAIEHSPLPPGTINFEITETAVIRNVAEAGKLMAELQEMGCRFALDDFGAGLSSFDYLRNLPVDYLKIDGMFIRNLLRDETDRIFVKSIIDIAHALNIKTVAECIENDETLQLVRELGADYGQGSALGKPFVLAPKFPSAAVPGTDAVQLHQQAG